MCLDLTISGRGHDRSRAEQVSGTRTLLTSCWTASTDTTQNCEWRISIYGRQRDEWDKLARWIVNNKLYSHNVRWLIQVPRLYDVYKQNGSINTFEDIVRSEWSLLPQSPPRTSVLKRSIRRLRTPLRGDQGPFFSSRASCVLATRHWLRHRG